MRTAVEDKEGAKGIPGYIAGYETFYPDRESPYASFDEEDGTMTLHTLVYWDGILLDDGTRGKHVYTESIDEVKLDGFTDYDVHILSDECVFSTTHKVRLDITEDPHDVCYELVHGLATTEKIEEIANNKVNPLTESREVEFTLREGLNTIVAISYDKQQKRYINVKEIYCMPEDAQNWRAIGTGKFTEDAISGLGAGMGVPTYDVAVEENVNTPGYYRIVNAYADSVKDYQGLACHDGHNHYLYIDASVPTQVMLTQQHTGVKDEKLGNIYITSKAYEDMMAGKMRVEYAKHLGTLENGIISFPKESVGVKLPEYQQDYIWWVNTPKCFGLTLPVSGIKDIEYGQQAAPRQPKSVFRHHKIQLCVRFDA